MFSSLCLTSYDLTNDLELHLPVLHVCVFQVFLYASCQFFRCHVVDQFNRGIYDYIIATDEVHSMGGVPSTAGGNKKGTRKRKRDKEYGVARGIDFQGM